MSTETKTERGRTVNTDAAIQKAFGRMLDDRFIDIEAPRSCLKRMGSSIRPRRMSLLSVPGHKVALGGLPNLCAIICAGSFSKSTGSLSPLPPPLVRCFTPENSGNQCQPTSNTAFSAQLGPQQGGALPSDSADLNWSKL